MLKANLAGLFDLKVLVGEYNLADLLELYSQKCGLYDDSANFQAKKLRKYRSDLDLIERKMIQNAANYYNL